MRSLSFIAVAGVALAAGFSMAVHADGIATGPDPGTPIPAFEAQDQHGKVRTFENLRGRKGLLLLFYRTADW